MTYLHNFQDIALGLALNRPKMSQHLYQWHNYRQSKLCGAIRHNHGVCFGHWILKFEIYL